MLIEVLRAKLHRVRVTEARLEYEGSLSVDESLLRAAGMVPYEFVRITNLANGAYWSTYLIPAPPGSGTVCLNGSSARWFHPGDSIIVLAGGWWDPASGPPPRSRVVLVDEDNRPRQILHAEALDPSWWPTA